MKQFYRNLTLVILASALSFSPLFAKEGKEAPARRSLKTDFREIHGKVDKIRDVQVLTGHDSTHMVVLLQVGKGSRRDWIVDLGPKDRLQLKIKVGDALTLQGRKISVGRYNNVLLADRVSKQARTEQISRSQKTCRDLQGTIQKVIKVRAKATGNTHLVGQLKTQSGEKVVVDLGNAEKLKGITIKKGTKLTVEGRQIRVRHRPVLMATRVISGDTELKINREELKQKNKNK